MTVHVHFPEPLKEGGLEEFIGSDAESDASSRSDCCDSSSSSDSESPESSGSQDLPPSPSRPPSRPSSRPPSRPTTPRPAMRSVGSLGSAVTCDNLDPFIVPCRDRSPRKQAPEARVDWKRANPTLYAGDKARLREHIRRSQAVAKATAAIVRTSHPMEACEAFSTCAEQFWDSPVKTEICLKPDFAPVPAHQDDYQSLIMNFLAHNSSSALLSFALGDRQDNLGGEANFLGRSCVWLGHEIHGQAWRLCQLRDHDAMRLCLQRGMRVEDKRSKAGKSWFFAETAKAAEEGCVDGMAPQAHLYMPLHGRDGCIGLLHLASSNAEEFTEAKQESFAPLAEAMGMQVSALRLQLLLERERSRQQALATDYRSMLESMLPSHVVDELTKARTPSKESSAMLADREGLGGEAKGPGAPSGAGSPMAGSSPISTVDSLPMSPCRRSSMESSDSRRGSKRRPTCGKLVQRMDKLAYAEYHDCVAILFTDIKGFTSLSEQLQPDGVMVMLDDLFGRFDDIIGDAGSVAYKVETIGDAYMVAFGLFEDEPDENKAAASAIKVAAQMIKAAGQVRVTLEDGSTAPVEIRAGVALGQIMSGIIGKKMPRYCMFGDTVNTASRMESTGVACMVHVTESTRDACIEGPLGNGMHFQDSGGRKVKGKGFMNTYLLDPDQVLSLDR